MRLYHVTDSVLSGGIDAVPAVVLAAVRGGAGIIQLRDKHASDADLTELVQECRRLLRGGLGPRAAQIPLVVDDRLAVAERIRCHLHVGQGDVPARRAREVLGDELMIGLSTGTPDQVREALSEGSADVLGIGPVRATDTKADAASPLGLEGLDACLTPWVAARRAAGGAGWGLPRTVAIGGIDAPLAVQLAARGVEGVCVVSRIAAAEEPERAASELLAAFDRGAVDRGIVARGTPGP
nr:thiamine phosphate synthase [Brachybacterium sacelli]